MNFRRAFFTVGGFTLLSRLSGFVRDILAANILGAGMAADAFFVALRLPNLFRRLFAEGAFTISFVPLFTGTLKEGQAQARAFASEALSLLVVVLLVFTLLMLLGMPWLMHLITPGYSDDPVKFALAVQLSQITFPYLFLISLAALLGSILNALGRFGPYAAAPVMFNLTQIAALLIWNESDIQAAQAQAWAVSLSGLLQLLWLAFSLRRAGWSLSLHWPRLSPMVRRLLKLIGPGALGAGVMQINLFIDMVLASQLPDGAVSYLSYADRLFQLPVGVIGIAIGTALLPLLSHTLRTTPENALSEQNRALEFALFLGVPAAVGLGLLAEPILIVLYEHGAFTAQTTELVALALMAYSLAIPAMMANKVLTVAFYAREDTRTPFRIAVKTVAINSLTSITLLTTLVHFGYERSAHAGLALSTALTAWLNVFFLGRALKANGHLLLDAPFRSRLLRLIPCVVLMGAVLALGAAVLAPVFRTTILYEVLALGGLIGGGGALYLASAHMLGVQRLDEIWRTLRRRPPKGAAPVPMAESDSQG